MGTDTSGGGNTTTLPSEPGNVTRPHAIATYSALRYGQGAKTLVFLDNGDAQSFAEYNEWVSNNPPIADTQFIFVTDAAARDTDSIEEVLAVGATAWIAPCNFGNQWTVSSGGQQVPQWWLSPDGSTAY